MSASTMSSSDSTEQIAKAIELLQDAIDKEAVNKKAVRADIVAATNILMGILGLPSVAPDIGGGRG